MFVPITLPLNRLADFYRLFFQCDLIKSVMGTPDAMDYNGEK